MGSRTGSKYGQLQRWSHGAAAALTGALIACSGGSASVQTEAAPAPQGVMLAIAATPDSVVKLAKFALGSIEGKVQLPRIRPQMTTVANHYLRDRDGGGQTQVAVIAAIGRQVADTAKPVTHVELSVWVLDMPHQLTAAQRRAGVPSTPLTTNAPAIRHPRAMTEADTTYWKSLEVVVEAFAKHGARRLP